MCITMLCCSELPPDYPHRFLVQRQGCWACEHAVVCSASHSHTLRCKRASPLPGSHAPSCVSVEVVSPHSSNTRWASSQIRSPSGHWSITNRRLAVITFRVLGGYDSFGPAGRERTHRRHLLFWSIR